MAKSNQYFRFLLISIVWTSALLTLASCGSARLTVMSFNVRQSHVKKERISEYNPNGYPVVLSADFNTVTKDKVFDIIRSPRSSN